MNAPLSTIQLLAEHIEQARSEFQRHGHAPIEVLERLTGHDTRTLVNEIGQMLGMRILVSSDLDRLQVASDLVPLDRCLQRRAVLAREPEGTQLIVISNPFDVDLIDWLSSHLAAPASSCLAAASDIQVFLEKQTSAAKAMDFLLDENRQQVSEEKQATVLSYETINDAASPAVKLVSSTLYDALKAGASDIHIESTSTGVAIKYRIDGVLIAAATIHGLELAEQAISRLKVLAELDIAEKRTPQDGSFRVIAYEREIDLRLSIMPSIHGEDAVIRVLDKQAMIDAYGSLTLQALGLDNDSLQKLRKLAQAAHGMLLVTGPTGSGKTTTLYAAIAETNTGQDKIITIEDPVEYQLPGVLQIPVNEKKGLTFARGLRSILRHDPDKIMVGEIRDAETAQIAVQSALTGHLVLTTVHANNVFDVFGRFTHMGIDPYAFVSALNGIWAQRLIRTVCRHCRQPHQPSDDEIRQLNLGEADIANANFMRGAGCGDCRGSGYKGRRAIAEILVLNDEIRELIIEKASLRRIKECARMAGTRSMREASLALAFKGETTLEEILRVTLDE